MDAQALERFAETVFVSMRGYVDDALAKMFRTLPAPAAGKDGKDAPAVDVDAIVSKVLAGIPKPKDGADGKSIDESMILALVDRSTDRMLAAIPKPKDGAAGIDGKDAKPVDTEWIVTQVLSHIKIPANGKDADPAVIADQVRSAVAGIPPPDLRDHVRAEVERAVAALPPADKGEAGRDYDPTVLQAAVVLEVNKAAAAIKAPEVNLAELAAQVFDRVMKSIPVPKDGTSITVDDIKPLLEGEVSRWELDFERRAQDVLARAYERAPKPKDGKDGFGLADFEFSADTPDGGRTLVFQIRAGGRVQVASIKTAAVLDAKIWRGEAHYARGDCVSYGGQLFIAQTDTTAGSKPGESGEWRLAVRRGKDGKDASE